MHKSETNLNLFARYEVVNPVKLIFMEEKKIFLHYSLENMLKICPSYVYCKKCIYARPNCTMKELNIAPIQSKSQIN